LVENHLNCSTPLAALIEATLCYLHCSNQHVRCDEGCDKSILLDSSVFFHFTYLTGTAVYAVVVSSTNAEVTDTMLIKASETAYANN
jgi:hypothetical protein